VHGVIEIVLVAPQIAPNTGNIVRLCANAGARLHLIEPLGFTLDDAALRRGGLDYHELADTTTWSSWSECRAALGGRWFATSARASSVRYDEVQYRPGDVVAFGCEQRGLPSEIIAEFATDARVGIPMRPDNRSLNLASAVAIITYEAWRQEGFVGTAFASFEEARPPLP
jgi:tRNA (cytidine/uridine-2'-O-)-methyltransferase